MPSHHVFIDERNFFSRYLWVDKHKSEKECRVEAFSKIFILNFIILENIKEVIEEIR